MIPKIYIKNNKRYEFLKKCNNNLFLYQDQYGNKECFTRYDLKMIKPVNVDKVSWENEKMFKNYLKRNRTERMTYGEYLEREEEYKEDTSE